MPTNIWLRLEPNSTGKNLESGLQAAIYDPLWMLTRQWQLGEFLLEDAASPVQATLEMKCIPITRYSTNPLNQLGPVPLEVIVEREPVRLKDAFQPRLSAEAGLHFMRLLELQNGSETLKKSILKNFSLQFPDESKRKTLDHNTINFLRVMTNRVPDGHKLYTLNNLHLPEWTTWYQTLSSPEKSIIDNTVKEWSLWFKALFNEPGEVESAWQPNRMEYNIHVAAPTLEETTLIASEYVGGHLDWYSFNSQQRSTLGAEADGAKVKTAFQSAIPTPINYPGMPVSRYWEFEDAKVNLGAMATGGREQLAKLLLIDFALVAGDDWYIIPVVVDVGMLCNTLSLNVRNTFGETESILSAYDIDRKREKRDVNLPWDLFRISSERQSTQPSSAQFHLFLPPTLSTSLHGADLEEVLFLRDEMANMAWAVERLVEGPIGQTLNRSEAYFRSQQSRIPPSDLATSADTNLLPLVYRLESVVPDHWIPLQPERIKNDLPAVWFKPHGNVQGRILKDKNPIHEEEVPREGAFVTRSFQYARWINGETYLWMSRRKGVGRGEGSSGLQFDRLEPPIKGD